jgi:hypothetical protein
MIVGGLRHAFARLVRSRFASMMRQENVSVPARFTSGGPASRPFGRGPSEGVVAIGLVWVALVVALAGCGSSGKSTTPASTAATPTTTGANAAQSAVAAAWATFFDAKTPTAKRVDLLQDGQQFATVIGAQSGSGLAASATAQVTRVVVQSPTQADVTYSILVAGVPALANQTGVAVKQDGTWKVGDASFCGLLSLENGGATSGLPPACAGK